MQQLLPLLQPLLQLVLSMVSTSSSNCCHRQTRMKPRSPSKLYHALAVHNLSFCVDFANDFVQGHDIVSVQLRYTGNMRWASPLESLSSTCGNDLFMTRPKLRIAYEQ